MMSQLGFITLSASTAERVYFGKDLNSDDQAQLDRVPTVTDNLLANIPRLETVRAMLQRAHGVSPQPTEPSVERRAVALRAALEFDALISNGCSRPDAIEAMRASARPYPRQVIEAVQAVWCDGVRGVAVEAVPWSGLRVGMVLAADIVTTGGTLLAARGFTITERFVERAYQFGTTDVHDDILVIAARRGSQEAESSSHRKAEGEQS